MSLQRALVELRSGKLLAFCTEAQKRLLRTTASTSVRHVAPAPRVHSYCWFLKDLVYLRTRRRAFCAAQMVALHCKSLIRRPPCRTRLLRLQAAQRSVFPLHGSQLHSRAGSACTLFVRSARAQPSLCARCASRSNMGHACAHAGSVDSLLI